VALERTKSGAIDNEETPRFEREARVLSSLTSPHTVEVFDFGVRVAQGNARLGPSAPRHQARWDQDRAAAWCNARPAAAATSAH
jgi:hypothetical protein